VDGGGGGAQEAAGLLKMVNLEIEFAADGKWTVSASMLGQSKTETGTWRFVKADGQTLILAAKLGQNPEREVRVEFTDHEHLSMVPPNNAGPAIEGMKLDFVREK
jgi:hypothetical protein